MSPSNPTNRRIYVSGMVALVMLVLPVDGTAYVASKVGVGLIMVGLVCYLVWSMGRISAHLRPGRSCADCSGGSVASGAGR